MCPCPGQGRGQSQITLDGIEDPEEKTSAKLSWGRHFITEGFKALEAEVSKSCGKYCFKDHVTAADIALVPQIYNARRFKVDMEQFPTLLKIEKELLNKK